MKRREQRETIFKLLFMTLFNSGEEMPEQLQSYLESLKEGREELDYGADLGAEEQSYIREKYELVSERLPEIDEILTRNSKGWKPARMNKVDLTILRLGVYEMLFDEDIPVKVAIDEAVELAKNFGGDESGSFVNGILGRVYRASEKKA